MEHYLQTMRSNFEGMEFRLIGIEQDCLPKLSQRRQMAYEAGSLTYLIFSKVLKEEFGVLPSEYFVKVNLASRLFLNRAISTVLIDLFFSKVTIFKKFTM